MFDSNYSSLSLAPLGWLVLNFSHDGVPGPGYMQKPVALLWLACHEEEVSGKWSATAAGLRAVNWVLASSLPLISIKLSIPLCIVCSAGAPRWQVMTYVFNRHLAVFVSLDSLGDQALLVLSHMLKCLLHWGFFENKRYKTILYSLLPSFPMKLFLSQQFLSSEGKSTPEFLAWVMAHHPHTCVFPIPNLSPCFSILFLNTSKLPLNLLLMSLPYFKPPPLVFFWYISSVF